LFLKSKLSKKRAEIILENTANNAEKVGGKLAEKLRERERERERTSAK
jgi:hypothetical protein